MPLRRYTCKSCENPLEIITSIKETPDKYRLDFCKNCRKQTKFCLEFPNTSFILGGPLAVSGSGFHATDYGKKNSDLVYGRAKEVEQRLAEHQAVQDKRIAEERNKRKGLVA